MPDNAPGHLAGDTSVLFDEDLTDDGYNATTSFTDLYFTVPGLYHVEVVMVSDPPHYLISAVSDVIIVHPEDYVTPRIEDEVHYFLLYIHLFFIWRFLFYVCFLCDRCQCN